MNNQFISLIICLTPLQMVIADKIIQLNPDKTFELIVIAISDNDKYKYYYKNLSKKCVKSFYFIEELGLIGFLKYVRKIKKNTTYNRYKNIYLSSIDSKHIQFIVSKNHNANVYTFDDGSANIISNSLYYTNFKPPIHKRVVFRTLGIKTYMEDIKKKSLLHYTIYKNSFNIIENTKFIPLYDNVLSNTSTNTNIVNFYLGQPIEEFPYYSNKAISKFVNNLGINFYYPHPRETKLPTGDFKVIISDLIFEDFIVQYLQSHPNTEVNVYSFMSSAALNIAKLNRVTCYFLYNDLLISKFDNFYKTAERQFNIKLIKV